MSTDFIQIGTHIWISDPLQVSLSHLLNSTILLQGTIPYQTNFSMYHCLCGWTKRQLRVAAYKACNRMTIAAFCLVNCSNYIWSIILNFKHTVFPVKLKKKSLWNFTGKKKQFKTVFYLKSTSKVFNWSFAVQS